MSTALFIAVAAFGIITALLLAEAMGWIRWD
jgi:hypothetical protein